MGISKKGADLIKHFESCKLKSYKCSAGRWTIGWGSTFYKNGKRVAEGEIITQEQADALFLIDVTKFEQGVLFLLKGKVLKPQQKEALISFGYNVGLDIDQDTQAEGLGDSTLLKKVLNNPADPAIKDEFIKWRSKGTVSEKGLLRRRLAEWHYYSTGELKFQWDAEIKSIMNT